jgi:beta-mannosidase
MEDGKYMVYGVNDLLTNWEGSVRFGAFHADGRYIADIRKDIMLEGNTSAVIASAEYPEADGDPVFVFACLFDKDKNLVARTRYNGQKYSELKLLPSKISAVKTADGFEFSSDVFVMGVCLGLDGDEPVGDNMFDLYPGQKYSVQAAGLSDCPVLYDLNTFLQSKYGD